MSTLFDFSAAGTLWPVLAVSVGQTVTYTRGDDTASVTAVVLPTAFVNDQLTDAVSEARQLNAVMIKAADLILDGSAAFPEIDDVITLAGGEEYRVIQSAKGAYSFVDPGRTILNIFCARADT